MEHCQRPLFDTLTDCRNWIEAAIEYTNGTHDFDDICAGIYGGKFHLLARPEGCLVLEIHTYPRKRALHVFLAGGDLSGVKHLPDLEQLARDMGATEITATGRAGWARVLASQGWAKSHVTMRKEI